MVVSTSAVEWIRRIAGAVDPPKVARTIPLSLFMSNLALMAPLSCCKACSKGLLGPHAGGSSRGTRTTVRHDDAKRRL